jgi:hypothetical protein
VKRSLNMPIRKCRQIQKAVGTYNVGQYHGEDLAFTAALSAAKAIPWPMGRLIEVCLVADWGSIQNFSFASRVAMALEIDACWPLLQQIEAFSPTRRSGRLVVSTRLVDVLERASRLLSQPGGRRQLSFVSKYLHFCVNDAYPIWDKNARIALAHRNPSTTWASYRDWMKKVGQEAEDHKACCLGYLRLPGGSRVRTLDKALYIIGQKVRKRYP